MGNLISLDHRRADNSRPTRDAPIAFFFDLSCPLSYLVAERVERTLGEVRWVPVPASSLGFEHPTVDVTAVREHAQARARALRLPLVWPERFPADARCALRAASLASELGFGARFALAASRLAFCGGFDLDDPETLAEAAAAAGLPLDGCLTAASDTRRDAQLQATADGLRFRGVQRLPAIRVGRRWLQGEPGLMAACAVSREPGALGRPLAPVG